MANRRCLPAPRTLLSRPAAARGRQISALPVLLPRPPRAAFRLRAAPRFRGRGLPKAGSHALQSLRMLGNGRVSASTTW
jgi:hypothetical protein